MADIGGVSDESGENNDDGNYDSVPVNSMVDDTDDSSW